MDPYGTLLSVSYRTPLSECSAAEVAAALAGGDQFVLAPKAKISFGKPGEKAKTNIRPGFDAASQANAQAVGSEPVLAAAQPEQVERGADGKPLPPPQTFWHKYWCVGDERWTICCATTLACARTRQSDRLLTALLLHDLPLWALSFCELVAVSLSRIYIVPVGIFMLVQAVVAPPEPAGPSAGGAAPRAQ